MNKAIYPKLSKKQLLDVQQQLSTKKLANKFSDLLYYNTRESFARYYRKIIQAARKTPSFMAEI